MSLEADLPAPQPSEAGALTERSRLRQSLSWVAHLLPAMAMLWILERLLRGAQQRWQYPFDIEWMEGGMLVHAWRLREGLGLYVEPSAEFVPYIYPPLYPWVLSLLGEPDYSTARIVSLTATLLAAAAAAMAVRREGGSWGWGLGAAGLFISCYEDSGTFYDLVRNDALALCLGAWSLVLCRSGGRRSVVAGGLLLFLAFTAKHNLAALGLPILIWLGKHRSWRRGGLFALASAGPALTWLAALQWSSAH